MRHLILRKTFNHIIFQRCLSSYDVVILGGGIVGSSLALSLGRLPSFANKKLLLVESEKETIMKNDSKYRSRACALSPSTHQLLKNIDAWKNIEEMRFRPVKYMQVWDSGGPSCISFGTHSDDILAYVVENDVISAALNNQIKLLDNVHVLYKSKVVDFKLQNSEQQTNNCMEFIPQVKLTNGETVEANLLIGADGVNSSLRKHSNLNTITCNYRQHAVVAVVSLEQLDSNNTAWQRFLRTGPIALLPLSSDKSCLIWSTTTEFAKQLIKCDKEEFISYVNNAFTNEDDRNDLSSIISQSLNSLIDSFQLGRTRHMLPPMILDVCSDSVAMFPLTIQHATHYVQSRLALIGDAAHRLHPLSGQGLNLGFGDVECLTNILHTAALNGADLGSIHHLLEYESDRQRSVLPILMVVDSLNRIYSSSFTPLVIVRNLACQLFDSISPIKNLMIQMASGLKS